MTNQQAAINNPEAEVDRKRLMELYSIECDKLAKTVLEMEMSYPRRVILVQEKDENGNVGPGLRFENHPLVQKVIDQHTKRWQDLIDEHNKKYGFESIKM
jgi:hypothetical protein